MIDRYFAIDTPFWRFFFNTLVISCLCLFPLLLIYVALTPGFGPMLMNDGLTLHLFLRQVVTDGLLVVFLVNYLGFLLYVVLAGPHGRSNRQRLVLVIDPPFRAVTFIFLHGLIYFNSADWFGSFNGDHWLALRVVGPTLARSALFANLEGVYLYATLFSTLPVYTVVIGRLLSRDMAMHRILPQRLTAILLAVGLSAVCALLVTAIAIAVAYLTQ